MNRYYCPYCPVRYQFHEQRSDGVLICGQCGDPLLRKPFVKTTQIFALIAAIAFTAPFILLVFGSLKNLNKPTKKRMHETITIINEADRNNVGDLHVACKSI
tara:strand:+ start:193 stop:498 length:306 start_codon:yes stop_codon:yes gene_type:complete